MSYSCRECGATFPSSLHRTRHEVDAHPVPDPVYDHPCMYGCGKTFPTVKAEGRHQRVCPRNTQDFYNVD